MGWGPSSSSAGTIRPYPVEVTLQQDHRGDPVDRTLSGRATLAALDERPLGRGGRETLVHRFHRQAGNVTHGCRETFRGGGFRATPPVHAQRQTDNYPLGGLFPGGGRDAGRKRFGRRGWDGGQGGRDGAGRIADGQPHTLRARVDGEDPHARPGYGDGDADGLLWLSDAAWLGSTMYLMVMRRESSGISGRRIGSFCR